MKIVLLAMLLGSALKVGEKAPAFTLPDTEGRPVSLAALLEQGPVILAFFPKAFTSGWTREVRAYRDQYAKVTEKGAQVVGISTDDVATLKRFKGENQLPYPLLSDDGGKIAKQYGGTIPVFGVANRTTFVLEKDGTVKDVIKGGDAIDPGGAITSCPLHKKGGTP